MSKERTCAAQVPVADLVRARQWYAEKLGLEPIDEDEFAAHYVCGGGSWFSLHRSGVGPATRTVLGWLTPDIEREVAELKTRGVTFESYDLPGLTTDADGIATLGPDRVAWFGDGEGNVLALGETEREALRPLLARGG